MKKFLFLLAVFLWAGSASAATMRFNVDDALTGLTINGVDFLSLASEETRNPRNWWTVDTIDFTLQEINTIVWTLENGPAYGSSPMGLATSLVLDNGVMLISSLADTRWSFISAQGRTDFRESEASYISGTWFVHLLRSRPGESMTASITFQRDGSPVAPVPVPAAAWLLGSGLLGLAGLRRIRK